MSALNESLQPDRLRPLLLDFWQESLDIAKTRQGLALAVPQSFPDGWQMVVDVLDHLPAGVKISDGGRTLGWLSGRGQNIETEAVSRQIREVCESCDVERDGYELLRWIPGALAAVDIHVFAEALVSIAHLHYLREAKPRTLDIPDQTLRRIFVDHHVTARANAPLQGKVRQDVKVDYLVEASSLIAFELIRRQGRILPTMEQWGFRWPDLRAANPNLRTAMIYDPHSQEIDRESRAIGRDVCDLFCSYEETDRIHEFLATASS